MSTVFSAGGQKSYKDLGAILPFYNSCKTDHPKDLKKKYIPSDDFLGGFKDRLLYDAQ